jgi:hypothetical protein
MINHALDLMEKSPSFTDADKQQIRERRQGNPSGSPEWKDARAKCTSEMSKGDVACAMAAKEFDELSKCGAPTR